jgi:hypothetical protein
MSHKFTYLTMILLIAGATAVGQVDKASHNQSINNLTLSNKGSLVVQSTDNVVISGKNPVSVDQQASMTLVSGKSIRLLPGTRISSGGFMYASISNPAKKGKHSKKVARLVTVEENEKMLEQAALAQAATYLTPFTYRNQRQISSFCKEPGLKTDSGNHISAVISESSSKQFAVESNRLIIEIVPIVRHVTIPTEFCISHAACRYVLRL